MKVHSLLAVAAAAAAFVLLQPAIASAAVPNDDFDSATVIGALPFADTVDMTQATTAADDPLLCFGEPASPFGTVWYSFTPAFSGLVRPTVTYLANLSMYTGGRGSLTLVTCGATALEVTAGVTYHFMLASLVPDLGETTWSLDRYFPPEVALTVNATGFVNPKTGVATVSGTFSCSNGAIGDDAAGGSLLQLFAKRVWIQGSFDITSPIGCTGETIPWTAPVVGSNGLFAAGKAHVQAFITACDPVACTDASVDQDIQLKSARPR
jgi:hypothetical protein